MNTNRKCTRKSRGLKAVVERVARRVRSMSEPRRGPGQPTKYQPAWMPRIAQKLCARGATMSELADAFNVASCTLYIWINEHEELRNAIQVNADIFNHRVERALAERALGFWVVMQPEERDPETGEVLRPAVRQYYPPDPRCTRLRVS